jgi:hypothetical protein
MRARRPFELALAVRAGGQACQIPVVCDDCCLSRGEALDRVCDQTCPRYSPYELVNKLSVSEISPSKPSWLASQQRVARVIKGPPLLLVVGVVCADPVLLGLPGCGRAPSGIAELAGVASKIPQQQSNQRQEIFP